jgi:tetratricopeptide (TPR) repeat protein
VLDAAKRYTEAAEQYSAADKAGYPRAAAALGGLYYLGLGVPKDAAKAIALYRRAGDAGYAEAYAVLGTIYLEQQPPNYRQAIAAYDRATRAGSPLGQVGLGEMYGGGVGVTKDPARGRQPIPAGGGQGRTPRNVRSGRILSCRRGRSEKSPDSIPLAVARRRARHSAG